MLHQMYPSYFLLIYRIDNNSRNIYVNERVPGFAKKPEIKNPRFHIQFALFVYKTIDKYD